MSKETKVPRISSEEFDRQLHETQAGVVKLYKDLLVKTFFPPNGDDLNDEEEDSKLIKPATPHQPGIVLSRDGDMKEVDNGIYQGPSEPGQLEGREYIKASETIFQSILPQEPKPKSNRCI
jgi:hypothetical protein